VLKLNKWTKTRSKSKPTLILKDFSLRVMRISVHNFQHSKVLIIFRLILQTVIARVISTEGERVQRSQLISPNLPMDLKWVNLYLVGYILWLSSLRCF